MILTDLVNFENRCSVSFPSICLIVGKERQSAVDFISKKFPRQIKIFDGEAFTIEDFIQEVETMPLFQSKNILHIQEIEYLDKEKEKILQNYLVRPNPWVILLLSTSSLDQGNPLFKEANHQGIVLILPEEKPWEKEKSFQNWLIQEASNAGKTLSTFLAQTLIKEIGLNKGILRQELEKIFCYLGKRKSITLEDLKAVCCSFSHETLWQLGDLTFSFQRAEALDLSKKLMEAEHSFFSLIAHLRTQIKNQLLLLEAFRNGGAAEVTKSFPYLKGTLLQKKVKIAQSYGVEAFKRGLSLIYAYELQAKNSQGEPSLLMELLLIKLTKKE